LCRATITLPQLAARSHTQTAKTIEESNGLLICGWRYGALVAEDVADGWSETLRIRVCADVALVCGFPKERGARVPRDEPQMRTAERRKVAEEFYPEFGDGFIRCAFRFGGPRRPIDPPPTERKSKWRGRTTWLEGGGMHYCFHGQRGARKADQG